MAIGMPGMKSVISGMRLSSEVVIEINMARAMIVGGIRFFISKNGVILSPGNQDGMIPSEFFKQVIDVKKQEFIYKKPIDYLCVYDFEC